VRENEILDDIDEGDDRDYEGSGEVRIVDYSNGYSLSEVCLPHQVSSLIRAFSLTVAFVGA
jgi:hypothetical protein